MSSGGVNITIISNIVRYPQMNIASNVLQSIIFSLMKHALFALIALQLGCQPTTLQNKEIKRYPYTLISSKTTESDTKTFVELNALVTIDSILKEEMMNSLLDHLYDSLMSTTGYEHSEHPNTCNIFVFTSVEHAESGMAQWAGNISKSKNQREPIKRLQNIYFRVVKENNNLGGENSSLTLDVKKKIWNELIKTEDEAEFLAEQKYPIKLNHTNKDQAIINLPKNTNYNEELLQKFRKTIIENFDIDQKTLKEISNEGLDKGWAFPKRE
jgi:hypothetical protein